MRLLYVWLFCVLNLVAAVTYFVKHWSRQKELYWSVIALMNTKTAMILTISQVVSLYSAVVMTIHHVVFKRTKEGERFVDSPNPGSRPPS